MKPVTSLQGKAVESSGIAAVAWLGKISKTKVLPRARGLFVRKSTIFSNPAW